MSLGDKWAIWRAKSEEDLVRDYVSGADPDSNAWCVCHWQWKYSRYWRQLCQVHEAMCLLAWEADPPTPEGDLLEIFEALAALNVHVRGPVLYSESYVRDRTVQQQTYWLKNRAIKEATDAGLVFLRRVEWIGECHTCGGSGIYDRHAIERCRRCSGCGRISLSFIECNVANRYAFHQPYDHTHPFRGDQVDWLQPHAPSLWAPNQAGRKLKAEQVSTLLALLKRRFWDNQPRYVHEIFGNFMEVAA